MKIIERINALHLYAKQAKRDSVSYHSFVDILPSEFKKILQAYKCLRKTNVILEEENRQLKNELKMLRKGIDPCEIFDSSEDEAVIRFDREGTTGT